MSSTLLHEYVTLMLEKIRTKKGQKGAFGDKFDLKKFKTLPSPDAMLTYAKHFLQPLGQGTSRAAFLLSSKYVLKVALNKKGLGQNQAELDVYTSPASKPVVSKIYSADENHMWIIADLVRPIKTEEEFRSLAKIDWDDFRTYIRLGTSDDKDNTGSLKNAPEFVKAVIQTARSNHMLRGDIIGTQTDRGRDKLDHWGKTPDGRIVLLDYGLNEEVWSSQYKPEIDAMRGKSASSDEKTANGSTQKTNAERGHDRSPPDESGEQATRLNATKPAPSKPMGLDAKKLAREKPPYARTQKATGTDDNDPEKTRR